MGEKEEGADVSYFNTFVERRRGKKGKKGRIFLFRRTKRGDLSGKKERKKEGEIPIPPLSD